MPADVNTMMYAGEKPWHGLGVKVEGEVNSAECIKLAGLDWDVEVAPIVTHDHKRTAVDNYRVTRRVTDSTILGVVKKGFQPIQNRQAFKLFDSVVGEGAAVYHTAGALQGGSKVWLLAKLPEVMEIGRLIGTPDEVERYLLLSNAHDGTRPLQMLVTPVRVVCSNTLGLALSAKDDAVSNLAPRITIKHVGWSQAEMHERGRIMKLALKYYQTFGDFANFLYGRQVSSHQVNNVLAEVFPPNKRKEVTPAIAKKRMEVERLFVEGKGHDVNGVRGSAWALLNAFTEFADHKFALNKAKERQDVTYSIWMGGARGLKNRATKAVAGLVV